MLKKNTKAILSYVTNYYTQKRENNEHLTIPDIKVVSLWATDAWLG